MAQSEETANQGSLRNAPWLTALERELKSRVGWIDEAVSPFAGRRRARTERKIEQRPLPTDQAA